MLDFERVDVILETKKFTGKVPSNGNAFPYDESDIDDILKANEVLPAPWKESLILNDWRLFRAFFIFTHLADGWTWGEIASQINIYQANARLQWQWFRRLCNVRGQYAKIKERA